MSILASLNIQDEHILLVGTHSVKTALSRIESCLNIDPNSKLSSTRATNNISTKIIIVQPSNQEVVDLVHAKYSSHISTNQIQILDRPFDLYEDITSLGRPNVNNIVDRVFVNLEKNPLLKMEIFQKCSFMRIPINTYQQPELSTFHMIPAYKNFETGLQIGITTNGNGCILGSRLKKELINKFIRPYKIDKVVKNCGELRTKIQLQELALNFVSDTKKLEKDYLKIGMMNLDEDDWDNSQLNELVLEEEQIQAQRANNKNLEKSRWLSQIIEYYPLEKLASVSMDDLNENKQPISRAVVNDTNSVIPGATATVLASAVPTDSSSFAASGSSSSNNTSQTTTTNSNNHPSNIIKNAVSQNDTQLDVAVSPAHDMTTSKKGTLSLVGSGPGSLSMLTLGALNEIQTADLILADKLVPEQVLSIIPKTCELFIAKKFPGNAERAQEELMERALAGLQQGFKVVRLKQGDPYIFGRGGEEFQYFNAMGDYEIKVLPGLSSSLGSTVLANIPATQRDVADQVLILTGTGRKGVLPEYPPYVANRTTIFLMALHRAEVLQDALINGKHWDPNVPVAIIERASCVDQRVVRTKLKDLSEVVKIIGSRPPGLIVMGRSVDYLNGELKEGQLYDICEGYDDIDVSSYINGGL
ncbi:hypothetical protein ACO0RG_003900 [Hanseniaspora osmophila]